VSSAGEEKRVPLVDTNALNSKNVITKEIDDFAKTVINYNLETG